MSFNKVLKLAEELEKRFTKQAQGVVSTQGSTGDILKPLVPEVQRIFNGWARAANIQGAQAELLCAWIPRNQGGKFLCDHVVLSMGDAQHGASGTSNLEEQEKSDLTSKIQVLNGKAKALLEAAFNSTHKSEFRDDGQPDGVNAAWLSAK